MSKHYYSERIAVNGREFEARLYYDGTMGHPWEEEEGHGPVRKISNRDDKRPGERIMWAGGCAAYPWAYDIQAATVQATSEGWGLSPTKLVTLRNKLEREPTKKEVIAAAVQADFEHLNAWITEQWYWLGVAVLPIDENGDADESDEFAHACWGIESGGYYWREVAAELASEIIRADAVLAEKSLREAVERASWAERDVMTVGA